MKSFAILAALVAASFAAPATTLSARADPVPACKEIFFQVVNFETALQLDDGGVIGGSKSAVSFAKLNEKSQPWDAISTLVGGLNDGGNVGATGIIILTPLEEGTKCNLYNADNHVIAEMDSAHTVYDFNWHFDTNAALRNKNPRRTANGFRFECVSQ